MNFEKLNKNINSTNPPLQTIPTEPQIPTVAGGPGSSGLGINMAPRQVAMEEEANQHSAAQRTNPLTVIAANAGYPKSVLPPEQFELFRDATLHARKHNSLQFNPFFFNIKL